MDTTTSKAAYLTLSDQKYFLEELAENFPNLKRFERKIISARTNYFSFNQLQPEEKKSLISDIVLNATVNFGFEMPPSEKYSDTLIANLEKIIVHAGYGNYTEGEFLLCMFLNRWEKADLPASIEIETVPITGKVFNTVFFQQLLLNYAAIRKLMDSLFLGFLQGYSPEGKFLS